LFAAPKKKADRKQITRPFSALVVSSILWVSGKPLVKKSERGKGPHEKVMLIVLSHFTGAETTTVVSTISGFAKVGEDWYFVSHTKTRERRGERSDLVEGRVWVCRQIEAQ
jgi:uncharacterized protein YchJ